MRTDRHFFSGGIVVTDAKNTGVPRRARAHELVKELRVLCHPCAIPSTRRVLRRAWTASPPDGEPAKSPRLAHDFSSQLPYWPTVPGYRPFAQLDALRRASSVRCQ